MEIVLFFFVKIEKIQKKCKKNVFFGVLLLLLCKKYNIINVNKFIPAKEKERIEFYEDFGYQRRKLLLEVSAL